MVEPQSMPSEDLNAVEHAIQGHPSDKALEEYSLDKLADSSLAAVEEHLLICRQCRARLEEIEPVKYIHYTEDGPVCARITRLTTGKVVARHWGQDLHAGRAFGSFYAAKQHLSESFSQMYPEHTCKGSCGSPQFRDEPDLRNCPILSGNPAALDTDFCDRILRDLAQMDRASAPARIEAVRPGVPPHRRASAAGHDAAEERRRAAHCEWCRRHHTDAPAYSRAVRRPSPPL